MSAFLAGLASLVGASAKPSDSSATGSLTGTVSNTAGQGLQGPAATDGSADALSMLASTRGGSQVSTQAAPPNLGGVGLQNNYVPGPGYSPTSAPATGGGATGDLANFMAAERQIESSGNYGVVNGIGAAGAYQFLPATWNNDAMAAGYGHYANGHANLAPPAVQDAVAKYAMQQLYNQYGNWGDVAEAWFGGPGGVGKSYTQAYEQDVLNAMKQLAGA